MRRHLLPLLPLVALGAQVPDPSFFLGAPGTTAQACAERAFTRKPKAIENLVCLGQIRLALGQRKQAEVWFSRAEELEPGSAETCRLIAQAWLRAGIPEPVRGLAQKALERAPRNGGDLADFAVVLLDSGFPGEARTLMGQVLVASPKERSGFIAFGCALLRAGQPKEAATWLDRAIAINPAKTDVYREIALVYADHARRDDLPEVKARMLAAADTGFLPAEKDNDELAERARVHLAAGQRPEAEALFLRIMKSKAVHAEDFQKIGQAWLRAGFMAEAFRAYEVLPSAPGAGGPLGFGITAPAGAPRGSGWGPLVTIDLSKVNRKRALGDAATDLVAAGYFDKALPLMEEAFLEDAKDQQDLAKYGRMALLGGRREAAARFFHKAVQADPKDWETWYHVGQAYADAIPRQTQTQGGPTPRRSMDPPSTK